VNAFTEKQSQTSGWSLGEGTHTLFLNRICEICNAASRQKVWNQI